MKKNTLFELLNNKLLIILMGNVGTGKSTLAEFLVNQFTNYWLSGDKLTMEEKIPQDKLFGVIYEKTEEQLLANNSVIIDGRNLIDKERMYFASIALKRSIPVLIIDCGIGTKSDLLRRIKENRGESPEVWNDEFEKNMKKYEKPTEIPERGLFVISKEEFQNLMDFTT